MNLNVIFPIIAGIIIAIGHVFLKKMVIQHSLLNSYTIYPIITGLATVPFIYYSYKTLPIWEITVIISSVATISTILLGVFVLHEFITPLKSFLVALIIILLIVVMVIK